MSNIVSIQKAIPVTIISSISATTGDAFALPTAVVVVTWQSVITGSPVVIDFSIQTSIDGINWNTIDGSTSTSDVTSVFVTGAVFVRVIVNSQSAASTLDVIVICKVASLLGDPAVTGTGLLNRLAYWVSTNVLSSLNPGTAGQVLTSNGASAPSFQTPAPLAFPVTVPNSTVIFQNSSLVALLSLAIDGISLVIARLEVISSLIVRGQISSPIISSITDDIPNNDYVRMTNDSPGNGGIISAESDINPDAILRIQAKGVAPINLLSYPAMIALPQYIISVSWATGYGFDQPIGYIFPNPASLVNSSFQCKAVSIPMTVAPLSSVIRLNGAQINSVPPSATGFSLTSTVMVTDLTGTNVLILQFTATVPPGASGGIDFSTVVPTVILAVGADLAFDAGTQRINSTAGGIYMATADVVGTY